MTIGEKLLEARKRRGMSQESLAAAIGTSKQNIYKYEKGIITNIPLDKLEALAAILEPDPAELLGWRGDDVQTSTTPAGISDDALRFALWGGDAEQITQEQLDEVKRFAAFVRERDKK